MAHITLSIPDELYAEMRRHPQIKWSEAAREGINRQLSDIRGVISGKELVKRLPTDIKKSLEKISQLPANGWKKHYKKMKVNEKRRASLIQASL